MTGSIAVLVGAAAIAGLVFMAGHKRGAWAVRFDYPRGFDCGEQAGIRAERERWEQVTGATYERLLAEVASDVPDLPGNDGWPYLFTNLQAAGERHPPPADVLLAAADTMLGLPPRVPDAPPDVAEITDARPSGFVKYEGDVRPELLDAFRRALAGDVPTVTGVVVTPSRGPGPDPAADWDLLAGAALPDYVYAPDALNGHRTVDELLDSIVHRKVTP